MKGKIKITASEFRILDLFIYLFISDLFIYLSIYTLVYLSM